MFFPMTGPEAYQWWHWLYLAEVMFVRFFHCKVYSPPFPLTPFLYCVLWEKSPCPAHSWGVGIYVLLSWGWSIYINCWNFFIEDLSLHFFIDSIIYLYWFRLMDIYLLLWVIGQGYFVYSVIEIIPTLAIGSSLRWPLHSFGIPLSIYLCIYFFEHYLPLGTAKSSGSCCAFPAPVLEPTVSSRTAWY